MAKNRYLSGIDVSVSVLAQLLRYLSHLNVDRNAVFQSAGVDPEVLRRPDTRMPLEDYVAIEDEAARVSTDPYFGLHMGEFFEAGNWSILGYMMMSCKNLAEAGEKAGRYQRIIGNLIYTRAHIGFKKITILLLTPPHAPKLSRHCFEAAVSSTVRMMRTLSGRPISPIEVGFISGPPKSKAEYERVFRCPVHFGRKRTYIVFDWSIANMSAVTPNASLLAHFEAYAKDFLSEMEEEKPITQEVTRHILAKLDSRTLSIGGIAREMRVSVRTLQNRLKSEGRIFSEVLEETRERVAKKHLRENSTVEDITYLLGFSEPSVFRKAFKKWAGVTPKEYRELALAGDERRMSGR